MKKASLVALVAALVSMLALTMNPAAAQDSGPLSEGTDVTLRNTLQDPGEPEAPFPTLFGLAEDAYDENGTVSFGASEFPTALAQPGTPAGDISGLYDIDMSADSISFTMLPAADDPFWVNVFGEFPDGKFDRYYFTFSEPHNITGATSNNGSVSLRVDSATVVVVEIASGYDMNPPMAFELSLQQAAAAELAVTGVETTVLAMVAGALVLMGLAAVATSRRFA